jgi:hypothetical protein
MILSLSPVPGKELRQGLVIDCMIYFSSRVRVDLRMADIIDIISN